MNITTITQTCNACPSQWEGTLSNGLHFYARYRWGHFTFQVGENEVPVDGELLISRQVGDDLAGFMSTEEMRAIVDPLLSDAPAVAETEKLGPITDFDKLVADMKVLMEENGIFDFEGEIFDSHTEDGGVVVVADICAMEDAPYHIAVIADAGSRMAKAIATEGKKVQIHLEVFDDPS